MRRTTRYLGLTVLAAWVATGCEGSNAGTPASAQVGLGPDASTDTDSGSRSSPDAGLGSDGGGNSDDASGSGPDGTSAGPPTRLVITTPSLPNATTGTAYSTLIAARGTGPITWDAITIAPPDVVNGSPGLNHLTIQTTNGTISGTPSYTGLQPILATATDSTGTVSVEYELSVGGTGRTAKFTNAPPPGTVGASYPSFTLNTNWETSLGCTYNGVVAGGSFPPGVNANALGGTFSGTPTVAGTFPLTLYANGGCGSINGPTDLTTFVITINGPSGTVGGSGNWSRGGTSPVLEPSPSGVWDGFEIGSPMVIKLASSYVMYLESQDSSDYHYSVGLATSTDGIQWTKGSAPVLGPTAGAWDARDVRYPWVVATGPSLYRMYYWGSDGKSQRIGLATSTDAMTWTKSTSDLVTITSANPPLGGYGPGSVVNSAGKYRLFYASGGSIGVASSSDGTTFTDDGVVLTPSTGESYGRPAVVYDSNKYRAFFPMAEGLGAGLANSNVVYSMRIFYSDSADGSTWSTAHTVLAAGAPGAWDRPAVGNPAVISDGGYKMWYVGGRGYFQGTDPSFGFDVEGAIGYATSP